MSEEYEMKCTSCNQPWIEPTEERACCPNPTKPRAVEEVKSVDDIEHEIKAVDVVLRLLRADSSAAMTLDGKLTIQKHIRHVEGIRARLRRELFAAMDEARL